MGWVKIDDGFFRHPKVVDLPPMAKLLFVAGLCRCAEQMTDGFISKGALRVIAADAGVRPALARDLVERGLWHKREDGFEVHDYLEYQPSAEWERERRRQKHEVRAEAGRRGGIRSGESRRARQGEANTKQTPKQNGSKREANALAKPKHRRTPEPEPLVLTSRSDLHGWAPGVATTESEARKAIELIEWLWEVMAGESLAKPDEVVDVVCWAMSYLDGRVVEEAIGHLRSQSQPPRGALYVAKTLRSWGEQRGVEMPEWSPP